MRILVPNTEERDFLDTIMTYANTKNNFQVLRLLKETFDQLWKDYENNQTPVFNEFQQMETFYRHMPNFSNDLTDV